MGLVDVLEAYGSMCCLAATRGDGGKYDTHYVGEEVKAGCKLELEIAKDDF